ncbi:MAG TPA: phosphoribosylformimino-5-aminoimidazole carboxamide ribotide isomerase [Candidatus Blautia faecipullorum]|nr:phosphoribosylformimino-5-aminoimidazole carboxamide ribotide isomerase [Candidatus Blautia faecipullorum]
MRFRPCIDIHNGKVKQIVGGSLKDQGDKARENFVSEQDAAFYASLYRDAGLKGGHVILLNSVDSPYYDATRSQALKALAAYPGGLQLGGGVRPENAGEYLEAGASHVIVTSYVFRDGVLSWENLQKMERAVGKERLVLDLSCRKKDGRYYIVTDRWQKFTDVPVTLETMRELGSHCDEFLIHAVDVEGKASGIERELVRLLSGYGEKNVTYAGGVGSMEDIHILEKDGKGRLDVTVGSALDLFGGAIPFDVLKRIGNRE